MTEQPSGPLGLELGRADESLDSARILFAAGKNADAISRAYYAIFHAACALLAHIGRTARTHDGLRAMIGQHFVRTGLLANEHALTLARIASDRNEADYNVTAVFEAATVEDDIERAAKFLAAVRVIIGS